MPGLYRTANQRAREIMRYKNWAEQDLEKAQKEQLELQQAIQTTSDSTKDPKKVQELKEIDEKITSLKKEISEYSRKLIIPTEQLSPKGLSLLSYLYAKKDHTTQQPLIASSVEDFKHIIKLLDNSKNGTTVTIIFQPAKYIDNYYIQKFGNVHKTVFKIRKTEKGLYMLNMDSSGYYIYPDTGKNLAEIALEEIAEKENRKPTKLFFAKQEHLIGEDLSRQADEYQCGIFATKDARQLNRDNSILESAFLNKDLSDLNFYTTSYAMPAEYLKGIQSRTLAGKLSERHGETKVTRKGKTLTETQKKIRELKDEKGNVLATIPEYISYFSKKYQHLVSKFVEDNKENVEKIKAATEEYDAGKMTLEKLEALYGPATDKKEIKDIKQTTEQKAEVKQPLETKTELKPKLETKSAVPSRTETKLQAKQSTTIHKTPEPAKPLAPTFQEKLRLWREREQQEIKEKQAPKKPPNKTQ